MKATDVDFSELQLGVLEGFTNAFRLAKEAEKDNVVEEAVGELRKMALGALASLAPKDQSEVVRKWLVKNSQKKKKKKGGSRVNIRGCDLWLKENKDDVHGRAYDEGTSGPLPKYTLARWGAWHELSDEEKAEYRKRGEALRALVDEEGAQITPPSKPSASLGNAVDKKVLAFARKMLIEEGVYMTVLWGSLSTDQGPVLGLSDHSLIKGVKETFSDRMKKPDWDPARLWYDWSNFLKAIYQDIPAVTVKTLKESKAQRKTAFGSVLELDEATSLPTIPDTSALNASKGKTVQWWQHAIREFLTVHYAAASNGKKAAVPYARLKSQGSPKCLDRQYWLHDIDFEDPSKIKKGNCIRLMQFWRELQEGKDGTTSFRFRGFLDEVDGDWELLPAEYEEHQARWTADAAEREAELEREAARRTEGGEGGRGSSEDAVAQEGVGGQSSVTSQKKSKPKAVRKKPALSRKAKGKRRARTASPSDSGSDTDEEKWKRMVDGASGDQASDEERRGDEEDRMSSGAQDLADSDDSTVMDSHDQLEAWAEVAKGRYVGKAPLDVSSWKKRVLYLAGMNFDKRYQAAILNYYAAVERYSRSSNRLNSWLPQLLEAVPWATWTWGEPTLPEEVHRNPDGLEPLLRILEQKPWMRGEVAALKVVEQVLLAVGLSLRDIADSHFSNDPDDEAPVGIPAFVNDSKIGFATSERLLAVIESLGDAIIIDGEPGSSSFDQDVQSALASTGVKPPERRAQDESAAPAPPPAQDVPSTSESEIFRAQSPLRAQALPPHDGPLNDPPDMPIAEKPPVPDREVEAPGPQVAPSAPDNGSEPGVFAAPAAAGQAEKTHGTPSYAVPEEERRAGQPPVPPSAPNSNDARTFQSADNTREEPASAPDHVDIGEGPSDGAADSLGDSSRKRKRWLSQAKEAGGLSEEASSLLQQAGGLSQEASGLSEEASGLSRAGGSSSDKPPSKRRKSVPLPEPILNGRRSNRLKEGGEGLREMQRAKTLLAAGRGR
ncbi:uncharacterized protein B0H18DRAFT_1125279 [Fomitopsis serialis]|uniref:uncharacterized protein n=1 Tax=Fomitopsis serialis TaxID=139415 RepID=UPI002007F163|nr:uncharacterized protein B0H18DRAFT_1125279 [Neoantrodia serialis]KAH9914839.1 hypothetical protein B0H18DRAFT_1125279 [Neoantrodia serialis]